MSEKILKTRIQQKFATFNEWKSIWQTFIPLQGEVCKFQIPANQAADGLRTSSKVRVLTKTGDGSTTLINLPWDSAPAAEETALSKQQSQRARSLYPGSSFTVVTDLDVNDHEIKTVSTTFSVPSEIVLSSKQYGTSLPENGKKGKLFFLIQN